MDPSHSESDDLRFKLSVEATTLLIVPSLVRYDIDSLAFSACTPSPWCMNPGARRSDSLRRTPLFSLFLRQKHHAASSLMRGGFFHRSAVVPVPFPVGYTTTTTPANSEHETKTGFEQKVISRSQKSELKGRSVSQSLGVFGN